jgi:23S rRNA (adenine2503-C2)-methyltransferase
MKWKSRLAAQEISTAMQSGFIKNLTIEQAEEVFSCLGMKPYRARQLFNWLYEKNVDSFDAMTDFSKELRAALAASWLVSALEVEERNVSRDGTEKYLFRTRDGHFIEAVLLKNDGTDDGRLTVCISSQVGCAMGCRFCETAKIGFRRNLETAEIIDQVCLIRRTSGLKNNNIVFMGMGEPFMNYDSVIAAAEIMNYSFGLHISTRKITISTCGILPAIERYIDEQRPYNLALSLNDADASRRAIIMPVERRYPAADIAALWSASSRLRNRLTLEYIMRRDNISPATPGASKGFRNARIKINLIRLNPGAHSLEIPTDGEVAAFMKELEIMNIPISLRKSLGSDIDAACGQLSGRRYASIREAAER